MKNAEPREADPSRRCSCQIRIEPARRQYADAEKRRLLDIFGEPERWAQTLRSMLWTHTQVVVPAFTGDVVRTCLRRALSISMSPRAKYFDGLEGGDVPLTFLYQRNNLLRGRGRQLQDGPDPVEQGERPIRLPVSAWKKMMDAYYPNTAWLCLRRDVFERLHQYKMERGIPTWEQTLESMLP